MSRYARRVDDNQREIIKGLMKIGCLVRDTSAVGSGFPDILCAYKGRLHLLEIKDGNKPPSWRRITPAQRDFHQLWHGYVTVVNSLDEAIQAVTSNG